ncbi:hypothetical protein P378_13030 [Desulforamulus profundi]|uniref:Uncharacterized protein n=1 Tax=Desulforamulus profundi TaxID=1383067 RepID=A0A2C6MEE6_9FIRM|nr:hypothetical protein [Desulforamulus profundi]PHJ38005.1 hypothetical protein P378_13030 [Desulforamulus profundi]
MKRANIDELVNKGKKKKTLKIQLSTCTRLPKEERVNRKERDPAEINLLARSIMDKVKRYQSEGILIKNGRSWRFYF